MIVLSMIALSTIVPPLQFFAHSVFGQNAFAQCAVERVFNSLPETFLIALFVWLLLRILPRQNSRTRFAVWFIALIAVAALPWLPDAAGIKLSRGALVSGGTAIVAHGAPGFLARPLTLAAAHAIHLPASWAAFLLVAWALIACMMTMRLAVGLWRLQQLRETCKPVDPALLDPALAALFAELNASQAATARPVVLATSDRIRVPAAIGLWKPMIVLPAWVLRDVAPAELGIILRHEFAHLRHWDDWTNLIQKCVRALFFFHPAVWWIERRLSLEREMACDDAVVAQTSNPAGYASCLVSLLERSLAERGWTMAQAFVHRARETSMRLARILDNQRPVATRVSKPALALVGTFAVFCAAILPDAPPVVSFERTQPSDETTYSASLSQSAIAPAIRANFTVSPDRVVATPAGFKSSGIKPDFKATSASSKQKALRSAPPAPISVLAAREEVPAHPLPGLENIREPATDAFLAALSRAMFENVMFESAAFENAMLENEMSEAGQLAAVEHTRDSRSPTVFMIRTAEFVQSDPGSSPGSSPTIWKIQVWRVMLVDPAWQHKVVTPAAHST